MVVSELHCTRRVDGVKYKNAFHGRYLRFPEAVQYKWVSERIDVCQTRFRRLSTTSDGTNSCALIFDAAAVRQRTEGTTTDSRTYRQGIGTLHIAAGEYFE